MGMSYGMGMDMGFGMFGIIFTIMFLMIIGIIVTILISGIMQWNKNNKSPKLSVDATVVTKRTSVSHHQHANAGDITGAHGYHSSSSTSHYVTFQVESGDRMEFYVQGTEYGMLVEGDFGKLTFQGTRYLGFERR